MDKRTTIEAVLYGKALDLSWEAASRRVVGLSREDFAGCLEYVHEFRDQFILTVRETNQADEQTECLAVFYTLVKSRWILLDRQVERLARRGATLAWVVALREMLCPLLEAVGTLLGAERAAQIERMLAHPGRALSESDEVRGLREALAARDDALALWQPLREAFEGRSTREIVHELADALRRRRDADATLAEAQALRADFDRAFGGLTVAQVSEQMDRLEREMAAQREESRAWFERRSQLLDAFGMTDLSEIAERFVLQREQLAQQAVALARARQDQERLERALGTSDPDAILALVRAEGAPEPEPQRMDDLLGSLDAAMRRLTA